MVTNGLIAYLSVRPSVCQFVSSFMRQFFQLFFYPSIAKAWMRNCFCCCCCCWKFPLVAAIVWHQADKLQFMFLPNWNAFAAIQTFCIHSFCQSVWVTEWFIHCWIPLGSNCFRSEHNSKQSSLVNNYLSNEGPTAQI